MPSRAWNPLKSPGTAPKALGVLLQLGEPPPPPGALPETLGVLLQHGERGAQVVVGLVGQVRDQLIHLQPRLRRVFVAHLRTPYVRRLRAVLSSVMDVSTARTQQACHKCTVCHLLQKHARQSSLFRAPSARSWGARLKGFVARDGVVQRLQADVGHVRAADALRDALPLARAASAVRHAPYCLLI